MLQERKSNPKIFILLPLLLGTMLAVGILIGLRLQAEQPVLISEVSNTAGEEETGASKIEQLLRFIESKYVDDVDSEQLVDEAIESILKQLDPHSSYISAEDLSSVNEQLDGNFEGIGVEFMILNDTVMVVTAIPGGPAEQVGILAGDKIVQVEDSLIAGIGITSPGIIGLLKGEKGTKVNVGIMRMGNNKIQQFEIIRDRIPIESIDASYMITENTGYIKINRFAATTDKEFIDALEQLYQEGMSDLVIDLRYNPGGYLQKATNMLNQLFDNRGELMVYTKGRAVNRSDYKTSGKGIYNINKIAVLIDEGSASASEILAGAIQDHDRGIVVGRRSFGKGLVQEQYQLGDGSALRLTIARYYTPSGRSIQKAYDDLDAYQNDFSTRYESGELLSENNIKISDSTRYFTDNGRVVYSGGGIIPDLFVPLDTQLLGDLYTKLQIQVPNYAYSYIMDNHEQLETLDIAQFTKEFQVSNKDLNGFFDFAQEAGVKFDPGTLSPNLKQELKKSLKARVGKHFFDDEAFYYALNEKDPVILSALAGLKDYENILKRKKLKN